MQVQENISLRPYNSFGISATARYFSRFNSVDELQSLLETDTVKKNKKMVLGGGSNILLTRDYDGMILKNEVLGVEKTREDENNVYIKSGAGENWHQLVMYCIENDLAGIENLSLIPGCTGASPMQNIGAYGVEIKDVFHQLTAFHLYEKKLYTFNLTDCGFGYRESVFKHKYKDQFAILDVTLRLNKKPVYHTTYGAIQEELDKMGVQDLTIKAISDAVIRIRSSKLPDPKQVGNAGSFFKNPSIPKNDFLELKTRFPSIVGYNNPDGTVKLAAGWLIEQCGWKGFREGDAGVHSKQALVLVNYGNAKGEDIFGLSEKILDDVEHRFNVRLEKEVNII